MGHRLVLRYFESHFIWDLFSERWFFEERWLKHMIYEMGFDRKLQTDACSRRMFCAAVGALRREFINLLKNFFSNLFLWKNCGHLHPTHNRVYMTVCTYMNKFLAVVSFCRFRCRTIVFNCNWNILNWIHIEDSIRYTTFWENSY